jgi:hypothetical protein
MVALAFVGGALLTGAGSPATAAAPADDQRPAVSASFHFGTDYTIEVR